VGGHTRVAASGVNVTWTLRPWQSGSGPPPGLSGYLHRGDRQRKRQRQHYHKTDSRLHDYLYFERDFPINSLPMTAMGFQGKRQYTPPHPVAGRKILTAAKRQPGNTHEKDKTLSNYHPFSQ
jgi:hypothetical protein